MLLFISSTGGELQSNQTSMFANASQQTHQFGNTTEFQAWFGWLQRNKTYNAAHAYQHRQSASTSVFQAAYEALDRTWGELISSLRGAVSYFSGITVLLSNLI